MKLHVLMENTSARPSLACEHGLSLYIEACGRRILFDAGQTSAFAENADRMGVDLSRVDLAILSHGHYDHSGGLMRFLEINDHAPVYVHRRAFEPHYHGSDRYIGVDPALAASCRIIPVDDDSVLGDGLRLTACAGLPAAFPASVAGMMTKTDAGFIEDAFPHEQYLVIREGSRRIVVSGCSHKGVLNIVSWLNPDVLVGGFHFMKLDPAGGDADFLHTAAGSLLGHPCVYYTGHCTGEPAFAFLKARMGDRLHALKTGYVFEL